MVLHSTYLDLCASQPLNFKYNPSLPLSINKHLIVVLSTCNIQKQQKIPQTVKWNKPAWLSTMSLLNLH